MTKTPTPSSHAVNTAPISADLLGPEQPEREPVEPAVQTSPTHQAPATATATACLESLIPNRDLPPIVHGTISVIHSLSCSHIAHAEAAPTSPAQQDAPIVLDGEWRFRMLDGAAIERDEMGCGEHPALPVLEEGMKPKQFFDALGIELAGVMAEDQMDMDAYEAMAEAVNYNAWTPEAPKGDGWTLVAIFDTEDGPAAWWMREAALEQPARKNRKSLRAQAQQDAQHATDMQAVGEALMDAIESNYAALEAVGWSGPMDCPSEIVSDLLNLIDEAKPAQAEQDAPAAAVLYVSPEQLAKHTDPEGEENVEAGRYLPARKTPAGKFTQPLYAAAPAAVAVPRDWEAVQTELIEETRAALRKAQMFKLAAKWTGRAAPAARHEPAATTAPPGWHDSEDDKPTDRRDLERVLFDWNQTSGALQVAGGWYGEVLGMIQDAYDLGAHQAKQDAPAAAAVPTFETWAKAVGGDFARHNCGPYVADAIKLAGMAWRAALATAPAAPQAPAAPVDIAWRDGSVCNPPWTDDSSVRVIAITAQDDFGGVQVHDILASDFYGERTEVTNVCTHWAYRDEIWPRATSAAPASQDAQDAARLDAMEQYRMSVAPEYEGPWAASIYGEDDEPAIVGSGATPRAAIDAALATQQAGEK